MFQHASIYIHILTRDPFFFFLRAFLNNNYADLKTLNPTFDFMVRQCGEKDTPQLVATMMNGSDEFVDLPNKSEDAVENAIQSLVEKGFDANAEFNREHPDFDQKYERPW